MGSIFVIQGIMLYIYAFDHNPPHLHVKSGEGMFTITIEDCVIEGKAKVKTIKLVNDFIDKHKDEILEIWNKAQRGERINKINR